MENALLLALGLVLLAAGGEALVRGASRLASVLGVSPLVVGLTVVAFGTSMPELVVSGYASLRGENEIAVANVIGSNVFNVLFVLGLCALVVPLVIHRQVWRREVPLMIAASVLLLLFGLDGRVDFAESIALLSGLVVHVVYSVVSSRREPAAAQAEAARGERLDGPSRGGWPLSVLLVAAGLAALVLGGRWLVDAAVAIARGLGVGETVIGLTIVAAGTSLPEAAASLVATLRGEREIAVGNVVGSNVFNALGIVGVSGLLARGDLGVHPSLAGFDLPFMVAVSLATLPLFFTDRRLARWEGALFLAYYAAYTVYLVLRSTEHDALPYYSAVAFEFVLPITGVTILVLAWRAVRAERSRVVWKPGDRP